MWICRRSNEIWALQWRRTLQVDNDWWLVRLIWSNIQFLKNTSRSFIHPESKRQHVRDVLHRQWNNGKSYCLVTYMSIWNEPHYISLKTSSIYLCYYRVSWLSSHTSLKCKLSSWAHCPDAHATEQPAFHCVTLFISVFDRQLPASSFAALGLHHYAYSVPAFY